MIDGKWGRSKIDLRNRTTGFCVSTSLFLIPGEMLLRCCQACFYLLMIGISFIARAAY